MGGDFSKKQRIYSQKLWSLGFTALAVTLLLLTYQACSSGDFTAKRQMNSLQTTTRFSQKAKNFPICTNERTLVFTYVEDLNNKGYCYDATSLSPQFNASLGPVCDAGPSIADFNVQSDVRQSCTSTSICGVAPTVADVSSNLGQNAGLRTYELTYRNVPLGCSGEIVIENANGGLIESVAITTPGVPKDLCRQCGSGAYSCDCTPDSGAVHGICGSANGQAFPQTPTTNLCVASDASPVIPNYDKYSWTCFGTGGGRNAYCEAKNSAYVLGACGPYQGTVLTSPPSGAANLCAKGTPTEVRTLPTGGYLWECRSSDGLSYMSCGAGQWVGTEKLDGQCGLAQQTPMKEAPNTLLCAQGIPGPVSDQGTFFLWSCTGANGGATVNDCKTSKLTTP